MEYVTLNTGAKMPVLGLGVYKLGNSRECVDLIAGAVENGYRLIDTAEFYGNEAAVGEGIQSCGLPREQIFLTTKVWNDTQRAGKVMAAFENSLKLLQTDYVDLYLVHWPVKEKYVETWKILEEIYRSGRAKAIGVSNFQDYHIEVLKKEKRMLPALNQIESHPYLSQQPVINYCNDNGIIPQAWSPLGASKINLLENKVLVDLSRRHNKTVAQIILRWNIQRGMTVIPRSSKMSRIKENIDIFDFSLSDQDMQLIHSLNQDLRTGASPEDFDF